MKKRIISAIVMLIIVVPLVFIGGIPFKILTGIIAILAYGEILNLKGIKKYPVPVVIAGLISILALTISKSELSFSVVGLDYKRIVLTLFLMFIPTLFYFNTEKYTSKDAFYLTSFISFIGISLNLLSSILIYSKAYFWMIVIVTVMTDTFAYFTGVFVGKHKFSKISPNKTIEGCVGGIIMGTAIMTIYYITFIGAVPIYRVLLCGILMSIFGEIGDLFFSLIKRENNIKDFSKLIPGHGGIMDRIDSLVFVTLAYVLVCTFI